MMEFFGAVEGQQRELKKKECQQRRNCSFAVFRKRTKRSFGVFSIFLEARNLTRGKKYIKMFVDYSTFTSKTIMLTVLCILYRNLGFKFLLLDSKNSELSNQIKCCFYHLLQNELFEMHGHKANF